MKITVNEASNKKFIGKTLDLGIIATDSKGEAKRNITFVSNIIINKIEYRPVLSVGFKGSLSVTLWKEGTDSTAHLFEVSTLAI